jgi:hypothetical protein
MRRNSKKILLLFSIMQLCILSCTRQKNATPLKLDYHKEMTEYYDVDSLNTPRNVILLEYHKNMTGQYPELYDSCLTWHLDSLSIREILQVSKFAYFNEIDAVYNTWSCEYIGECLIDNQYYEFMINAGGYACVWNNDTSYYLIYFEENDFFLDTRYDPSKEE